MRIFLGLFLVPTLLGCQPTIGSDVWFKRTPILEVNSYYSSICSNYGFKPNSSEMGTCIQREIIAQKERNAINSQRASLVKGTSNQASSGSSFTFSFTKRLE